MIRTTMFAATTALLLGGCGGSPRTDVSTDAAPDSSIGSINSSPGASQGQRADGTAEREETASAKAAARARTRYQPDEVNAAQIRAMIMPGPGSDPYGLHSLRPSDVATLSHQLPGDTNYLPDPASSRTLYAGPR